MYPLIKALANKGFRVWFDTGIEAGTEWPEYIAERIDKCSCFIAFISKNALSSHNCRREINFAIELQKSFLSIYLEEVELTLGMKMQLNTLQSMFYYKSSSSETFIGLLSEAKILQCTRSGKAADTSAVSEAVLEEWYNTAYNYYHGQGTEQDYSKAVYWYTKAAEQGHSIAQNNLGICYYFGKGVEQDYIQAVFWYTKAAEQGHLEAQYSLGDCYECVPDVMDCTQAVFWYTKAAEQGHLEAQRELGFCYLHYDEIADTEKSVYWYTKAAEQGDAQAQYLLAQTYEDGVRDLDKDESKALFWYKKAAEQGDVWHQYSLGGCYEFGTGTDIDYAKALYWYKKAAEQGFELAQCRLGHFYEHGMGTAVSYKDAFYWYQKAAEHHWPSTDAKKGLERCRQYL